MKKKGTTRGGKWTRGRNAIWKYFCRMLIKIFKRNRYKNVCKFQSSFNIVL